MNCPNMMCRQATAYLTLVVLFAHATSVSSVFCTGGDAIDIQRNEKKAFACAGTTLGTVRLYWETSNTANKGFADDEYVKCTTVIPFIFHVVVSPSYFCIKSIRYFINVLDDASRVYRSGQWSNEAFASSVPLGDGNGGNNWVVEFECNLETPLSDCEDGDFSFALVDCGCPEGEGVVDACSVSSLATATDAVCAPTASPSAAPTSTDEPTSSPSLRPTPKPTSAPVPTSTSPPTPTPSSAPGFCFSAETTVNVEGRATPVPMKDLQVGDHVLTQSKMIYEPVYAFAHMDKLRTIEFLQIHTPSSGAAPLELTEEHMVFVEGKSGPVRAAALKVGDILSSKSSIGPQSVTKISTVFRQGLYAPLTPSGTIVVADGIVASNYIAMQGPREDIENEERVILGDAWTVPHLHQADVAHMWLSPMRMWCLGITSKMCDRHDEDGKHPYVALGLHLVAAMDTKSFVAQFIVIALALLVVGIFSAVEACFGASYGPLALLFVFSAVIPLYKRTIGSCFRSSNDIPPANKAGS
jgi:hypothetical protein